jgi:hypothetical protein
MRLYHFALKSSPPAVYQIDPGHTVEDVFEEVKTWMGVKLILINCN